ncbi:MAG: 3-methyl-2-oxobutanoate hydroxymethyltransferase [Gammaproteobacteria bacterium]
MATITLNTLQAMKQRGEKFTCLTVYDATLARIMADCGVEVLLVGDTLGTVIQGHKTTVPVKLRDMVYHTRNVARADTTALVMGDLPFMSYSNLIEATRSATRIMQAGAAIIKMEGGSWLAPIVADLTEKGIPVCAHLGLTPQSVYSFGGYKIQGRDPQKAQDMLQAALLHEQAGAKLLVLECIPYTLAAEITQAVKIPVIGIGAGPACDGQVLVTYDMLGLYTGKPLTFVKNFLQHQPNGVQGAIAEFVRQVKKQEFPTLEHSFV